MPALTPATPILCPLLLGIPMDVNVARQLCTALLLCWRCQKPGHFAQHCLLGLEVHYLSTAEQEELLLQLLAMKDATRALLPDVPTPELTPEETSKCVAPLEFSCLSIENEIAFSDTLHPKTEELQCSSPDVQIPTPQPPLNSLTPLRVHQCVPAWAFQMPQQYMMASSPSANSLCLDVEIETTDTQQACRVTALLDSGATGLFLDLEFVKSHSLTTQPLPKPIPVYNIDRTPNKASAISSMVNLVLCYWNHAEHTIFAITSLGRQNMILGFTWLHKHDSEMDWTKEEVTMSREALYEDNQSSGRALKEECGEEFSGVHELEFPDEAVEVGDWIYTTTIHPPPSVAEIWASQTTSQRLAQVFATNTTPQEFQDVVPPYLYAFEDMFSKALFDMLPECKKWNHAIELLPDSTPSSCKVYPLALREQNKLDAFLQENLNSGCICSFKSLMASLVFFIKKDGSL
ncbi:hypothetical protein E4T56_gene18425 [Termitomyces sp. T112]|nr:hypothetical protein E4T56_gene18425 [Termitomyces sp. T112]